MGRQAENKIRPSEFSRVENNSGIVATDSEPTEHTVILYPRHCKKPNQYRQFVGETDLQGQPDGDQTDDGSGIEGDRRKRAKSVAANCGPVN